LYAFGGGDVARDEDGVVVEVGLAQAGVEVPDFVGGGFAAFPLLVAGVVAFNSLSELAYEKGKERLEAVL
jgi:hypothetical protein